MGYCMTQSKDSFRIKSENKIKALDLLKELAVNNESIDWINTESIIKAASLENAFHECRWSIQEDDAGDVFSISFDDEKLGDDF